MIPLIDLETPALAPCASTQGPDSADLVWLLRRAEVPMTRVFDEACKEVGLRDVRDTLVLGVASEATDHTQTDIARIVGLDKSTLGTILDRLERDGLIERTPHPTNRKVWIPRTTKSGAATLEAANHAGREAVANLLGELDITELSTLRTLLWRISNLQSQ